MTAPWDHIQRRQLLQAYQAAHERLEALLWQESGGSGVEAAEIDALQAQLSDLWEAYAAGVPRIPLARCPYTGSLVLHSCDDAGLDGLWWRCESPVRPAEDLPPTFLALTGAVRLASPVEPFTFLCKPGPGLPYVLPHLLGSHVIKGVLRAFPIGRHAGFAITYFVELPGLAIARPNTWGTGSYSITDSLGQTRWGQADEDEQVLDFDLRPWLENGQLLWIAPDDASLALQTGAKGCPYLGLSGERLPQYVQYGEITTW